MSLKSSNHTFEEQSVQITTIQQNLFCIGRILRPHGRSGALFASLEDTDRLQNFPDIVLIEQGGLYRAFFVESYRGHKRGVLLELKGIRTRESAESLRDCYIYVPDNEQLPREPDEFFIRDLRGMKVYWKEEYLGIVKEILVLPYTELLEVENKTCRSPLLIPFQKAFVQNVDLRERVIQVQLPQNWLEIYR